MKNFEYRVASVNELNTVANSLLDSLGNRTLVAFIGKMGAGKTTFIKSICEELKVIDVVNSPTFSIINQYQTEEAHLVYHFDFYRLEKPEEALDIGLYDYLDSGYICLMEWPEKVEKLLPEECVYLEINEDLSTGDRIIKWEI